MSWPTKRYAISLLLIGLWASPAFAEEGKTLPEIDALRLEKAQLEVQFLEERVSRLKERAVRMLQDIQRREGTEGWTLDLDGRRWTKPDPPKQEGK